MERDDRFDVLKGIAIVLVVICHIMQHSVYDYQNLIVFNIIWSLQIPIFMFISGYFSISSKSFIQRFRGKTISYLLPFITYFFLNCFFTSIPVKDGFYRIINHIEFSLWYLYVLYVLSIINIFADFILLKVKEQNYRFISHSILFIFFSWLFLIPWYFKGGTFIGSKYIVYYSIFFYLGMFFHNISKNYLFKEAFYFLISKKEFLFAFCLCLYVYILFKYNIVMTPDTLIGVLPRLTASLCGVYILFYIIFNTIGEQSNNLFFRIFNYLGRLSLELYCIHGIFIITFEKSSVKLNSIEGICYFIIFFLYTLLSSLLLIKVLNYSSILKICLFGKKTVAQ